MVPLERDVVRPPKCLPLPRPWFLHLVRTGRLDYLKGLCVPYIPPLSQFLLMGFPELLSWNVLDDKETRMRVWEKEHLIHKV